MDTQFQKHHLLGNYNHNISQDRQHMYNVTMGHVPATTVAVEKQ